MSTVVLNLCWSVLTFVCWHILYLSVFCLFFLIENFKNKSVSDSEKLLMCFNMVPVIATVNISVYADKKREFSKYIVGKF